MSSRFQPATIVPTQADCAWAAGIIDGEGTILLARQPAKFGENYRLDIAVTNSDLRMLRFLKDRWGGGKIHNHNRFSNPYPAHWKATFDWRLSGRRCVTFLADIMPYLVCKRDQAEVALLFIDTIVGYGYKIGDETLAVRREMFASLRALKKEVSV